MGAEQDQLQCIQKRRLTATVQPADQDNGLVGIRRRKFNALRSLIKPEIVKHDLVEYHL